MSRPFDLPESSNMFFPNLIWDICNLLRGPDKRNEYRRVILPPGPVHRQRLGRALARVPLLFTLTVLLCGVASPAAARERLFGWCEQGGHSIVTAGQTSVTQAQQSFPSCTVTVYLLGTNTIASIFADNSGKIGRAHV